MESNTVEGLNSTLSVAGQRMEDLLLVDEAAQRLRVKPSWVYAHAEQIPGFFPIGRYVRFRRTVFERWLAGTGTCQ